MTDSDLASIQRLLSDFGWHADRGDGAAMSQLFLPDGTLQAGGAELKGREQIADDCYRRSLKQRTTRHVWSNLRVEPEQDGMVHATAIQLTFEQTAADQPGQLRVIDLTDVFKRDAQGVWLFKSRIMTRQMALTL